MAINESTVQGKWREIKGEVQKAWGNLTDDELEKTKGDATAIGGLIQQKYGHAKESYKEKLDGIFQKFQGKVDQTAENIKASLRK